jgi:hypothetical protein
MEDVTQNLSLYDHERIVEEFDIDNDGLNDTEGVMQAKSISEMPLGEARTNYLAELRG